MLKCHQIASPGVYFFKFSWGGMPPDPPRKSMLRMLSACASHTSYSVQVQVCLTNPELLPPPLKKFKEFFANDLRQNEGFAENYVF